MKRAYVDAGVVFVILVLIASDAWAYIDPGRGSFVQQLLASGVTGVALFARQLVRRLGSLFGRKETGNDGDRQR